MAGNQKNSTIRTKSTQSIWKTWTFDESGSRQNAFDNSLNRKWNATKSGSDWGREGPRIVLRAPRSCAVARWMKRGHTLYLPEIFTCHYSTVNYYVLIRLSVIEMANTVKFFSINNCTSSIFFPYFELNLTFNGPNDLVHLTTIFVWKLFIIIINSISW